MLPAHHDAGGERRSGGLVNANGAYRARAGSAAQPAACREGQAIAPGQRLVCSLKRAAAMMPPVVVHLLPRGCSTTRWRAVGIVAASPGSGRCGIKLHGQRDALACQIHLQHLDPNHVTRPDHFARVVDELVAELADMNEAILMHAQVHKSPELRHIADRAFQHHAGLQVAYVPTPSLKRDDLEVGGVGHGQAFPTPASTS